MNAKTWARDTNKNHPLIVAERERTAAVGAFLDSVRPVPDMLVVTVRNSLGGMCPTRTFHACPCGDPAMDAASEEQARDAAERHVRESGYPATAFETTEEWVPAT